VSRKVLCERLMVAPGGLPRRTATRSIETTITVQNCPYGPTSTMIVLSWSTCTPAIRRQDIARLRAEEDVDEIAKLCADLAAAGFIEPTTWH
jgi:hypothetical protein